MKSQQEYLDEKALHLQREADSFERSDTDGFMSQWANGIMAQLAAKRAEIAANGGVWDFPGLYRTTGERIDAKAIDGRFGRVWIINDAAAEKEFGRKFIPTDGSHREGGGRSLIQKRLGLEQRLEAAPAFADLASQGANVYVVVFRTDEK